MPQHLSKMDLQTERRIPLICSTDTTDGEGNMFIEGSRALSKMNGRLYRQCRSYRMKFALMVAPEHDGGSQINFEFYSLPNTYFVHGAIKYAYQTYWNMMADERAAGIKPAKWHDFMINEQNPTGVWEYASPVLHDGTADAGWGTLSADETITDSSVTDAAGQSQGFHLLGNLANSFNIFREFSNKLNYRDTPGTTSSSQPYDGLLDLDDADVLAERGDLAPYDRDWSSFLPDDAVVDDDAGQNILTHRGSIHFDSTNSTGVFSSPVMDVPLGLVWVRKYRGAAEEGFLTSDPELCMIASPGNYKGVYSHSLV